MKKIKLPLEMANGVMVTKSLEELKENWDLEKIVEHFVTGKLITWLNDRYYTDLAEQVQKITATGAEAQKQLCAVFGMEFKQDEVVDAEAVAERKRKLDILRQFTSDDGILKNVDHVAFNQEDLSDLLDEKVEEIYLCNGKFSVPLNISGKKYIGVADAEVHIGKDELIDFDKLGISFENVTFDEKYQKLVDVKSKKQEEERRAEEERIRLQSLKNVGDIIKFGRYEGEEIEWQILKITEGKALLITKNCVEDLPYHERDSVVTWRGCTLRKWLNSDFLHTSFNDNQCSAILSSKIFIDSWKKSEFVTDKIFILSGAEARELFEDDCYRLCEVTDHVKSKHDTGSIITRNVKPSWWLRQDPGGTDRTGVVGGNDGSVWRDTCCVVNFTMDNYVRPAMWVDLSKM